MRHANVLLGTWDASLLGTLRAARTELTPITTPISRNGERSDKSCLKVADI